VISPLHLRHPEGSRGAAEGDARMGEEGVPRETRNEDSQPPSKSRRIEAARAGHLPLSELTPDELAAFNTAVHEAMARRLASINWRAMLSRRGLYSVAMDDDGQIVVHPPSGPAPGTSPEASGQDRTDEEL